MTFAPPNSSAMDATAGSGGPITILPQIITGSPESIFTHVEQVLAKASKFASLLQQFSDAEKELEKAWSGQASEAATKKITDTLQSLQKIITVLEEGAQLLGVSGTMVKSAQTGYQTVVSSVNPTVASLMSNPWTYSAAVALSTSTSASLRGFVEAIGAALKALGAGQLATKISELATVIGDLEKLFGSTGQDTGSSSSANNSAIAGSPVTAPAVPASVATAAGQAAAAGLTGRTAGTDAAAIAAAQQNAAQATAAAGGVPTTPSFTDYVPSALGGTGAATGMTDAAAGGWVPVDSASQSLAAGHTTDAGSTLTDTSSYPTSAYPTGAYPTTAYPTTAYPTTAYPTTAAPTGGDIPASTPNGGQDVSFTTTNGDVSTTVNLPTGHDTTVDLDVTIDGSHVTEHAHVDADGNVTVS